MKLSSHILTVFPTPAVHVATPLKVLFKLSKSFHQKDPLGEAR